MNSQEGLGEKDGVDAAVIAYSLHRSLNNHIVELGRIEEKLANSCVPQGKKERLEFRQKILTKKVIPALHARIAGLPDGISY